MQKFFGKSLLTALLLFGILPVSNAFDLNNLSVDFRVINISPNDSSGPIVAGGSAVAGSGVEVDSQTTLDVSFNYSLTPNIALELLADIPSNHNVSANGLGALSVPNGTDVLETGVLPPTLFVQYQFLPEGNIHPYAGVGLNFTWFYDESLTSAARTALAAHSLSLDNSFGVAAQGGVDFDLNEDWAISADIKYVKINTTAKFTTALGATSVDVDIDPWVFGLGVTRYF